MKLCTCSFEKCYLTINVTNSKSNNCYSKLKIVLRDYLVRNYDDVFGLHLFICQSILVEGSLKEGREDKEAALLRGRDHLGHPRTQDGVTDLQWSNQSISPFIKFLNDFIVKMTLWLTIHLWSKNVFPKTIFLNKMWIHLFKNVCAITKICSYKLHFKFF